jgi:hypothetical protein
MKPIGPNWVLIVVLVVVIALTARVVMLMRRTRAGSGYRFGRDVYVRCRAGHVFLTTWIPGVSFKAVRLGLVRLQHCPVGDHLTAVTLLRDEDLSQYERQLARRFRDSGVP